MIQAIPPSPPRRKLRPVRLLLGFTLTLAFLAALHATAWYVVAARLEQAVSDWSAARRAEGWQIAHGPARKSGWPWAVRLSLPDVVLSAPVAGLRGGLGWQASELRLDLAPDHWRSLRAEARGQQQLRLGDTALPLAAQRLAASIPFRLGGTGAPEPLWLEARQLTLGESGTAMALSEADASLAGRALVLNLRDLTLPFEAPLGRRLEAARLEASASGALPALLRQGPPPASRAAAWRDSGGQVDLQRAMLSWGGVAITLSGRLGLDAALQPRGDGQLQLADPTRATDALAGAGLLPARAAALARGLLPLLARPDPAGGPPRLDVPVSLRDRMLNAGGIPLLRLPAIDWNQG